MDTRLELKKARQLKKLSLRSAGELSCVNFRFIDQIEKGIKPIPLKTETLGRLCKAYGLDHDDMVRKIKEENSRQKNKTVLQ
jgi:transcriptional regulator with XRE-family HTH domain